MSDDPYTGVPEWAKKEYIEESERNLICSQTLDGKIGSVYFGSDVEGAEDLDGGRIRLTHGSGPEESVHPLLQRYQFNVKMKEAKEAYTKAREGGETAPFSRWLSDFLNENRDNPPSWAGKAILEPEQAPDEVSGDCSLFEIFVDSSDNVKVRHQSRGEAVKYDTDKQTVAVLRHAIKETEGLEPAARNEKFYEIVKSLLPQSDIVEEMRKPSEV